MAASTFASRSYRDLGLVLRTHNLGEADRIITVLTAHHGLVRAVVKGVRRTSSKFGATLEPFMVADVQFVHGRSLDIVTQAISRGTYGARIVADYDKYTAAHAIAETAERLTETDPDSTSQHFKLLHGAIAALARDAYPAELIMNSYMLRALSSAGWAVTWSVCVLCGTPNVSRDFHAGSGGPVCGGCKPPGSRPMSADAARLLDALQEGEWAVVMNTTSGARHEASDIVSTYLQHHLERNLRSMQGVTHV